VNQCHNRHGTLRKMKNPRITGGFSLTGRHVTASENEVSKENPPAGVKPSYPLRWPLWLGSIYSLGKLTLGARKGTV